MNYYLRGIDPRLLREFKAECAYRGISMKVVIIDRISLWTRQSQKLRRKERKAGL